MTELELTWISSLEGWNRFAAVNDEFVDLHMSSEAARAAGLPDVIGMGYLRLHYLEVALETAAAGLSRELGAMFHVAELACRFTALNRCGDRLTVWARHDDDDAGRVRVDLGVRNQDQVETTPARAILTATPPAELAADLPETSASSREVAHEHGLERHLGQVTKSVRSWPISENDVMRWRLAVAFGAEDVPGGWLGTTRVPHLFNAFAWHPEYRPAEYPWMLPIWKEVGSRVLNGGVQVEFGRAAEIGERIDCTASLVDCAVREGSLGRMLLLRDREVWTLPSGQVNRLVTRTTIYY